MRRFVRADYRIRNCCEAKIENARSVFVVAAMIAIIASPALAQATRKAKTQRPPAATSYDVYSGGRWIGRDPDPSIRFEILRQQNWRKGG